MQRYAGKRFAAFLVCAAILFVAYVINNAAFASLATAIGLLFGAYAAGQSWTDNSAIKANGAS